jgi:hypothetical protein
LGGEKAVEVVSISHRRSAAKHILSRTISCLTNVGLQDRTPLTYLKRLAWVA